MNLNDAFRSVNHYYAVALSHHPSASYYSLATLNSVRIFGNANVGNPMLSNLQVAGQMGGGDTFVVQRWYARDDIPPAKRPLVIRELEHVHASFQIGHAYAWQLPIVELLRRRPCTEQEGPTEGRSFDPVPKIIPVRQNFSVQVTHYHDAGARIAEILRDEETAVHLWIHLEGTLVRDNYDRSRTTPNKNKLESLMAQRRQEEVTIEERVIHYLRGLKVPGDDIQNASMDAIIDGLKEERHLQ